MVIDRSLKGVDLVRMTTIEYIAPSGQRFNDETQIDDVLNDFPDLCIDQFCFRKTPLYYGPPSEFVSISVPNYFQRRYGKP